MWSETNKKYIKAGLTGLAAIVGGILCYFLVDRFDQVRALLQMICGILMPFVYGAVLAYILVPLSRKLDQCFAGWTRGKKPKLCRAISVAISLLVALLVIVLMVMIIVPNVVQSILSLVEALPGLLEAANERVGVILASSPDAQTWWNSFGDQFEAGVTAWSDNELMPFLQNVISGTVSYFKTFVTLLKDLLLGFIVAIYLLSSREKFANQARLLLRSVFSKRWADLIEGEAAYADSMFNGFFIGKLLDSTIVGLICFVSCLMFRFPYAPLISVIVGVTNIIPFFGPFIGAVPCALLLLIENPTHCVTFLIFIVILQQLDGNVIGPKILGDKTGLSGFWVTFAILLFGGLWGIVGMLVAIPLFAVIYDIIRRLTYRGLRKHGEAEMIEQYNRVYNPDKK